MKNSRWALGILGILLVLLAVWQIQSASQGLREIHSSANGAPIVFTGPDGAMDGSRPLVLVGHGLAASERVMRGFATTFAHAGYVVALWDFRGHGANPNPMPTDILSGSLLSDAETALAEAQRLGLADTKRLAILGHSMGSGVALEFGQKHPETSATIAVSPVGTAVTPALPHNLLLMAGSLEPGFVVNAEKRLAEAGGAGGDPAKGTARKMAVIPGVEHIAILFAPLSHATALGWLDGTFGAQPGAAPYEDHRIAWFGLGVLGTLLAAATLIPRVTKLNPLQGEAWPLWRRALALAAGAFAATVVLWAADQAGFDVSGILGLRVGGYLMLWYLLAGVAAIVLLGGRISAPTGREVLSGLLIFGALWLGVGLLGDSVWLPWLLIPRRLAWWPVASLAVLSWCWAVGEVSARSGGWGRMGWWVFQSVLLVGALTLAIRLSPELGFLSLILPLFPAIVLLQTVPNVSQKGAWPFAISGALFVGWMLMAVFPLQ